MSEEEKYIKCNNCKQDIPESKMFLHEGFCLRNNKYCAECCKVFLVKEFEEHIKTHNEKNTQRKRSPPPIPEKKILINKEKPSLTEHRKICKHNKKDSIPINKNESQKKNPILVDDNLGLKQCVFCTNMFEDLPNHLLVCKVKKMIEEENAKYYKDIEKRNKEDDILAKKLAKEKIMDISKDEEMARNLQKNLGPMVDTSNDEQMARNLQKNFGPMVDTSNDEQMARNLQRNFGPMVDTSNDEQMARNLQMQFEQMNININNDQRIARDLQNQYNHNPQRGGNIREQQRRRNNNQYQYGFNPPVQPPRQNDDMDEELKRAIEQSKREFYK